MRMILSPLARTSSESSPVKAVVGSMWLTRRVISLRLHVALASSAPQEKKTDPEEPKDQQLEKKAPEPPAPSITDKRSGGIPSEGPKESKKEVKQDSKPKEDKSKAPSPAPTPAVPGSRGETRVCIALLQLQGY